MSYKDIVMGMGGETSPLSVLPRYYWPLESDAAHIGTSSNANTGTLETGVSFDATTSLTLDTSGAANSSGSGLFTGVGGIVLASKVDLNNFSFSDISIAWWIKPTQDAVGTVFGNAVYGQGGGNRNIGFSLLGGGVVVGHVTPGSGDAAVFGPAAIADEVLFAAMVWDSAAAEMRVYINGALFSTFSGAPSAAISPHSGNPTIGALKGFRTQGSSFTYRDFFGHIGHVMVWPETVVSASEITALYAAGSGPSSATLTLTGVEIGSDVVIKNPSISSDGTGNNVVQTFPDIVSSSVAYSYSSAPPTVDIEIYRQGFKLFAVRGVSLNGSDASLPVNQIADTAYGA